MYPVTCGELYLVHWVFQRSAGVLYYYLSIVHHDLWCTLCMGLPTVSWCTVLLVLSDHCTQWPLVYCSLCMGFPTVSWCTVLLSDHCTPWPLVYLVNGYADGQLVYCTIFWPLYTMTSSVHCAWVCRRSAGVLYYYLTIVHSDLWCTLCMGLPTVSWWTVIWPSSSASCSILYRGPWNSSCNKCHTTLAFRAPKWISLFKGTIQANVLHSLFLFCL